MREYRLINCKYGHLVQEKKKTRIKTINKMIFTVCDIREEVEF